MKVSNRTTKGVGVKQPAPVSGVSVNLDELVALRQMARQLDITPRGKVLATRSGGHLSRFRGRGMEFDESRVYQPGDDVRNMDWRVTARAGVAHIKQYREERERPVWLAVDLGPSMRFGTRVAFKSVQAARAAALLAWSAADRGDRVGGLVFDESRHFERRPVARTRGLLPMLKALSEAPLPGEEGGFKNFHAAAGQLTQLVRPGSLVFMISDFSGLGERAASWLGQLSAGSELVLVHVYDPLEASAPPPGLYPVTDGSRRALLDTVGSVKRERWYQRFSSQVSLLEDLCLRYHGHLISLRTDQPVGETLAAGLRPRVGRRIR